MLLLILICALCYLELLVNLLVVARGYASAMLMRAEGAGGADDDSGRGGRSGRVAVRAADVAALGGPRGGRVCARQLHSGAPLRTCHPNCAAPGLGPCNGFLVFHTGCLPVML
jgi:hypothetical protein